MHGTLKTLLVAAVCTVAAGASSAQQYNVQNGTLTLRPTDGAVRVVDGDTFWIGILEIRLFGVDALELDQTCVRNGDTDPSCYAYASNELERRLNGDDWRCEIDIEPNGEPDRSYGRYIAICFVGDEELNRELVRDGFAFAGRTRCDDPPTQYAAEEAEGRRNNAGVHGFNFVQHPCEWRRANQSRQPLPPACSLNGNGLCIPLVTPQGPCTCPPVGNTPTP